MNTVSEQNVIACTLFAGIRSQGKTVEKALSHPDEHLRWVHSFACSPSGCQPNAGCSAGTLSHLREVCCWHTILEHWQEALTALTKVLPPAAEGLAALPTVRSSLRVTEKPATEETMLLVPGVLANSGAGTAACSASVKCSVLATRSWSGSTAVIGAPAAVGAMAIKATGAGATAEAAAAEAGAAAVAEVLAQLFPKAQQLAGP